jgi:hypothetical protein
MKGFTDELITLIGQKETKRLDNIMYEVAQKIQGDVIAVTYNVIDAFYQDYTQADGRIYIRTDEYKAKHNGKKNKKGQFKSKNKTEFLRGRDVSLMTAIKNMESSGQPSIGVCRPLDGGFGYQAGVIFDEGYFTKKMQHSIKGDNFTEWDIVEDFLWGVHGADGVYNTTPSAGWALHDYINSYKPRFDKHYKNALKKFNN